MPPDGLRERKKARTRAAIQAAALSLFREQGYDETTVQQIAAAAEVSESTFFRYFPTKAEVVLWDDFDPLVIDEFSRQPAELGALAALRSAMRAALEAAATTLGSSTTIGTRQSRPLTRTLSATPNGMA